MGVVLPKVPLHPRQTNQTQDNASETRWTVPLQDGRVEIYLCMSCCLFRGSELWSCGERNSLSLEAQYLVSFDLTALGLTASMTSLTPDVR